MEERRHFNGGLVVGFRMTAALGLAAFLLLGLPLLVAAVEGEIVVNELMWDETEYIELFNTTDVEIGLNGWTLSRQQAGGEEKLIIQFTEDDVIAANGYFLLEKNEAATTVAADKIAPALTLVNTGELVTLRDPAQTIVDQANQLGVWLAGENTLEGAAMERGEAVEWHTSTGNSGGRRGTPREENSEPVLNTAPAAAISGARTGLVGEILTFSAEDSSDAENDELTYSWTLGEASGAGAELTHVFNAAGSYVVRVTVSDGEREDAAEMVVTIAAPIYADGVVINEFLPNPTGADSAGEFIELKNTGSRTVDLTAWQLDDAEGGSTPYIVPAGVNLAAGEIKSFARSETKIALNNDGDAVRLLDPTGAVKSSFVYSESGSEGQSYNRVSATQYQLSTTVTPGDANIITEAADADAATEEDEDSEDKQEVLGDAIVSVALKDVREEEVGSMIETTGVISAPPGVLGEKILYLAGSGIQVYFHDEAWPELKLGDIVAVQGELTTALGEHRLKLAQAGDVEVVKESEPPSPHQIKTGEVDETLEGSLVIFEGSVTETSGDTFYVDDGSGAVKVYIKETTQIDKPKMSQGIDVTITGIVSQTKAGYRVLPRFQEDVRLGRVAGLTSFPATGLRQGYVRQAGFHQGYVRQAGFHQGYVRQAGLGLYRLLGWIDFSF